MNKRKYPTREEMQHLRDQGLNMAQIAERLGCSRNTVSTRFNEDAYHARLKKMVEYREAKKAAKPEGKQQRVKDRPAGKEGTFDIVAFLKAQNTPVTVLMPRDTRDNTGKLLGDPLPGRGYNGRHCQVSREEAAAGPGEEDMGDEW